jgi:hypothetical protein
MDTLDIQRADEYCTAISLYADYSQDWCRHRAFTFTYIPFDISYKRVLIHEPYVVHLTQTLKAIAGSGSQISSTSVTLQCYLCFTSKIMVKRCMDIFYFQRGDGAEIVTRVI